MLFGMYFVLASVLTPLSASLSLSYCFACVLFSLSVVQRTSICYMKNERNQLKVGREQIIVTGLWR